MRIERLTRDLALGPRGRGTIVLLCALLAGCASTPAPRLQSGADARSNIGIAPGGRRGSNNDVAMRALGLVGTPYRRAGSDPTIGFDCSGLVAYVYRDAAGLLLPRGTVDQYALDRPAPAAKAMRTGDLVFFATGSGGVSHVGIYVGEGRFVHAPNVGGHVRFDRLDDPYWNPRYRGARRVL